MTDPRRLLELAGIEITKMTGTGNDFILVDNRKAQVPRELMPLLARAICRRPFSTYRIRSSFVSA